MVNNYDEQTADEKKNVPEYVFKKYTIVVYADDHPELFKRENLYLSFR